ncbi:MAG: hypothetical protein A2Y93_04725 [Chloroflexi bacterium RBG_13_68_17]|nr:MAG: hypothetical protein A2Y93_04725 [Chloroflexi bacterium RBG_13_68_17]
MTSPCWMTDSTPIRPMTRPIWVGPISKRSLPNSPRIDSRLARAKASRKALTKRNAAGPRRASASRLSREGVGEPGARRRPAGSDSGSAQRTSGISSKAIAALARKGSDRSMRPPLAGSTVNCRIPASGAGRAKFDSVRGPAMSGPKIMPSPMAAPIIPIPPARSRASVVSAMYASAVGSVAEESSPASARVTNS